VKYYILTLLLIITNHVSGQIYNSISPNEIGLYFHAIDTVLADIKADDTLTTSILSSPAISFSDYPSKIDGIEIVIYDDAESKKISRSMNSNNIWLRIMPVSIIRNQLSIVM